MESRVVCPCCAVLLQSQQPLLAGQVIACSQCGGQFTLGGEAVRAGTPALSPPIPACHAAGDPAVAPGRLFLLLAVIAAVMLMVVAGALLMALPFLPVESTGSVEQQKSESQDKPSEEAPVPILSKGTPAEAPPAVSEAPPKPAPVLEDWALEHQEIIDHAEAQLLVRHGSINNLGFGWPKGFDPFTGNATPRHRFPWTPNPKAAVGTDRIMVPSSYVGRVPQGIDGYTASTSRPANKVVPIPITFTPPPFQIRAAVLQVFVDDFQSPTFHSRFQVTMNGKRVPKMEEIINALNQSGPIGKLITLQLPDEIVATLKTGKLTILVDDPTTKAGDGFAFDFFRLLINPTGPKYPGTLIGRVTSETDGKAIAGATVSAGGLVTGRTDADGNYELRNVPAGHVALTCTAPGYDRKTATADLVVGRTQRLDVRLFPHRERLAEKRKPIG